MGAHTFDRNKYNKFVDSTGAEMFSSVDTDFGKQNKPECHPLYNKYIG
jgi:hypothetical protein